MGKERLRHVDEFLESPYSVLPSDEVRRVYMNQDVSPDKILARFEWLEKTSREYGMAVNHINRLYASAVSSLNDMRGSVDFIQNHIPIYFPERKKRIHYAKKIEGVSSDISELEAILPELEARRDAKLEEMMNFDVEFGKELEFVYSHGFVDAAFAWTRLRDANRKSKAAEALLIAKNGVISPGELFSSQYLDYTDRQRLASLKNPDGSYLVSDEALDKRISEVSEIVNEAKEEESMEDFDYEFSVLSNAKREREETN